MIRAPAVRWNYESLKITTLGFALRILGVSVISHLRIISKEIMSRLFGHDTIHFKEEVVFTHLDLDHRHMNYLLFVCKREDGVVRVMSVFLSSTSEQQAPAFPGSRPAVARSLIKPCFLRQVQSPVELL